MFTLSISLNLIMLCYVFGNWGSPLKCKIHFCGVKLSLANNTSTYGHTHWYVSGLKEAEDFFILLVGHFTIKVCIDHYPKCKYDIFWCSNGRNLTLCRLHRTVSGYLTVFTCQQVFQNKNGLKSDKLTPWLFE